MRRGGLPEVIVADFETHGIEPRPNYPPKPVSLALQWPGRKPMAMSWGHPTGNNCTEKEARAEYKKAQQSKYPMLFQFGMFDQDVAEEHWELPLLDWRQYHDTMFLIFYDNPHAPTLALKPTAERLLGIPPEEQDRMKEWILANVPEAKRKPSEYGAYIWKCPYSIVKPYHVGDLSRTLKLFNYLWPKMEAQGMLEAYERDRKLMPILLRNARQGMSLDMDNLSKDVPKMEAGIATADKWLRKRLGIENVDSDKQLGDALYNKKLLHEYYETAKGQISVSGKYLTLDNFRDKQVFQVLKYRTQMSTSVSMFGRPWLELATASRDGRTIHPNWSQVRSPKPGDKDMGGARSGRIICSRPNFLNIPKKWKRAISAGYVHPAFLGVPELPFMRKYCLPDKGHLWGRRDFNQQELRLFAHFEEGPVMEGFLSNPKFDIHEDVRKEAEELLIAAKLREEFDRDTAKTGVFGRIYGQGVPGLAEALKLKEEDIEVARIIQRAINRAVPSIKELDDQLKEMAADKSCDPEGEPIRTWGGRLYHCEPPAYSKKYNRDMTFAYKLLNYLIQGSGADVTKETLIRYDEHPKANSRLIVTVYDEINNSVPGKAAMKQHMTVLRDVILSLEVDVPMLSDGEAGTSWGTLEKYPI